MNNLSIEIGIVIIGRNEGKRLVKCLESLPSWIEWFVYVDSGSTDKSLEIASKYGAICVELDSQQPFSAARARNTGASELLERAQTLKYIQFIDGDCELQSGWLENARLILEEQKNCAAVFGRRREMFPDKTIFNKLCDIEWNTPVGEAEYFGGDVLIRSDIFFESGGYSQKLIAGEEPEFCVRIREKGWRIVCTGLEMTLHDANISKFGQWYLRMQRGGFAFAEVYRLHRNSEKSIWKNEVLKIILWGGIIPAVIIAVTLFSKWGAVLLLLYPLQVLRLSLRFGILDGESWLRSFFLTVGKFAEFHGILKYYIGLIFKQNIRIIEYKAANNI